MLGEKKKKKNEALRRLCVFVSTVVKLTALVVFYAQEASHKKTIPRSVLSCIITEEAG